MRHTGKLEIGLKIAFALCALVIFTACFIGCRTAEWHVKKAIKKDPTIQQEVIDTIQFTQTFIDTVYTSDSTFYLEQRIVHYDTIVKWTRVQADFSEMKSWFETWQENKTDRKQIKNDRKKDQTQIRQDKKTDRTEIRQDAKTERGRSWWWLWLAIGIVATLVLRRVFKKTMDNLKI